MTYEDTPAGKAMSEAIELDIAGESPYPESVLFLDAGAPNRESAMARAFSEGRAVVLAFEDGSTQTVLPGLLAS
jgi:hypothetical protein